MVRIVPGSTPSPAARKDQDGKASTGDGAGTESLPPSCSRQDSGPIYGGHANHLFNVDCRFTVIC
jgi:hypothetical protein